MLMKHAGQVKVEGDKLHLSWAGGLSLPARQVELSGLFLTLK